MTREIAGVCDKDALHATEVRNVGWERTLILGTFPLFSFKMYDQGILIYADIHYRTLFAVVAFDDQFVSFAPRRRGNAMANLNKKCFSLYPLPSLRRS